MCRVRAGFRRTGAKAHSVCYLFQEPRVISRGALTLEAQAGSGVAGAAFFHSSGVLNRRTLPEVGGAPSHRLGNRVRCPACFVGLALLLSS
ncbi:hypothetical protein NDU88_007000 [Pleurodeles waltl]|uniref:Uncharacterized protein n=1 Tax=Pleurodeles waltl TaxID=8319 RepID=A0AAV7URP9_PLEWA|nr:hypothetical protein NDU88_007000 [Pleurodeles waltl]